MNNGNKALVVTTRKVVNEITKFNPIVNKKAVVKVSANLNLQKEDIEKVVALVRDYNAQPSKIGELMKQGCSANDVRVLYDLRRSYIDHYSNEEVESLKQMYQLWDAFYGEPEIDEETLRMGLDLIKEIDRPDLYLHTRLKLILNMKENEVGSSLEHLCDIIEDRNLLTQKIFGEEAE